MMKDNRVADGTLAMSAISRIGTYGFPGTAPSRAVKVGHWALDNTSRVTMADKPRTKPRKADPTAAAVIGKEPAAKRKRKRLTEHQTKVRNAALKRRRKAKHNRKKA